VIWFKQGIRLLAVIAVFLTLTGCGTRSARPFIDFRTVRPSQPAATTTTTNVSRQQLRLAVASGMSQKATISAYRKLADHLSIQTGKPTEIIQRKSNAEVEVLLANGGADIGLFSTGTYAAYNEPVALNVLVMQQSHDSPYHYAYIIVHKDSGITEIQGLANRTFAFTDPLSFSGHFYTEHLLWQQGKSPDEFFQRYQYTYSHLKALKAVAERVIDGAAIDSLTYEYPQARLPGFTNSIRIIAVSPPVGTGPVVVASSMDQDQQELIRSILLNMHFNQDMRQVLQELMIDRFIAPQPELYNFPRQIVQEMGNSQ
jgi:phosphonate transport system substrate-binding protein